MTDHPDTPTYPDLQPGDTVRHVFGQCVNNQPPVGTIARILFAEPEPRYVVTWPDETDPVLHHREELIRITPAFRVGDLVEHRTHQDSFSTPGIVMELALSGVRVLWPERNPYRADGTFHHWGEQVELIQRYLPPIVKAPEHIRVRSLHDVLNAEECDLQRGDIVTTESPAYVALHGRRGVVEAVDRMVVTVLWPSPSGPQRREHVRSSLLFHSGAPKVAEPMPAPEEVHCGRGQDVDALRAQVQEMEAAIMTARAILRTALPKSKLDVLIDDLDRRAGVITDEEAMAWLNAKGYMVVPEGTEVYRIDLRDQGAPWPVDPQAPAFTPDDVMAQPEPPFTPLGDTEDQERADEVLGRAWRELRPLALFDLVAKHGGTKVAPSRIQGAVGIVVGLEGDDMARVAWPSPERKALVFAMHPRRELRSTSFRGQSLLDHG